MSALPRIVDRLRAGGWRVGLGIKIEGDAPPPPDLLTELQAEREAVLWALVEETLAARLSAPAPDMVATILETFPQSTVVGEAEPLEAVVLRWLDEGAEVEPSAGGGVRLSAEGGRAMFLRAEGLARLPGWLRGRLQDNAAERATVRADGSWRPPAWAEEADAPRPGDWCRCCRGQRWWRPANPRGDGLGPGWRCATCHPPPPGCAVWEVRT